MSDEESDEGLTELESLLRDSGYRPEKRIGEGTFSSVFSVIRVQDGARLAVKHLIPTSSPERILLEVSSLAAAKGKDNVIPLVFVKRIQGDILLGMPYIPSSPKFSELILLMDAEEIKSYLANLLHALAYIHDLGIIHRDIKPANFLYDRRNKRYALCDFGLAQKVKLSRKRKPSGNTNNTNGGSPKSKRPVLASVDLNHSLKTTPIKKKEREMPSTPPTALKAFHALRRSPRKHPSSSSMHGSRRHHSKLKISGSAIIGGTGGTLNNFTILEPTSGIPSLEPASLTSRLSLTPASSTPKGHPLPSCSCFGKPQVCPACLALRALKAPRAGTPGFRPPEVLLKYEQQTTAVDVWAVGIIMLCILSRSYPFFHAPDDVTALSEMTVLFGSEALARAATAYGRSFLYEPPQPGVDLQELCVELCKRKPHDSAEDGGRGCHASPEAIDFLKEVLALVSWERISARRALSHPFLQTS